MMDIWVVGATGRSGQAIATELAGRGADVVWVGRDAQRLAQVAGGGRTHGAATVAQPAGGRRYAGGALVRARLGSDFEKLTLPDGRVVGTVGVPTGELEAARRASGAADVVAASSEVPAGRLARAALPILAAAIGLRPVR